MPEPIYITGQRKTHLLKWRCSIIIHISENLHSYVNNINTIEGGTHVSGFRRSLTRTLKNYAEKSGMLSKLKFDIAGDDFREGLNCYYFCKSSGTSV